MKIIFDESEGEEMGVGIFTEKLADMALYTMSVILAVLMVTLFFSGLLSDWIVWSVSLLTKGIL